MTYLTLFHILLCHVLSFTIYFSLPKLLTPDAASLVTALVKCLPKGNSYPSKQWRLVMTLVRALWLLDDDGHYQGNQMDAFQVKLYMF